MKKTIALILSLVMCFTLLAACSNDSGDSNANNSSNNSSNNNSSSDDTVYTLTVVNHDSSTSMCEEFLETLFNAISEESGGRLKFEYYPGGSWFGATETIDAVKAGSADICWFTTGSYGGVFPVSEFINLIGNGIDNAQLGSAVLNTMYKEIPEVAAEYEGVHVLALHGTSASPISTANVKIESPSDFTGLRLRVAGTIPTLYVDALGATATALPTSDVYDNLSKNALDGMLNDWHNIDCFNLYEPIKYCMNVSLNMTASGVLMNEGSYNALPSDLQEIIDKYFASYFAADMAGYWWDSCRYWVGDEMKENGVEIYEPNDEVYDYMFSDEILDTTHQGYVDFLNSKGLDGQALYDQCMAIVDRFADQYANVWDKEFNYTDWDMSAVDGYQANY